MEITGKLRRLATGAALGVVLAGMYAATGFAQNHPYLPAATPPPPAPTCGSQEGISCSEVCLPFEVNVNVTTSGVQIVEIAESKQVSMIAGMPIDFTATCPPGMFAMGGGYTLVPEGSTINMNEVRVMSTLADNTNPNGWNGWKVSVLRKPGSGAVDNCLKVEVRAICVQGN